MRTTSYQKQVSTPCRQGHETLCVLLHANAALSTRDIHANWGKCAFYFTWTRLGHQLLQHSWFAFGLIHKCGKPAGSMAKCTDQAWRANGRIEFHGPMDSLSRQGRNEATKERKGRVCSQGFARLKSSVIVSAKQQRSRPTPD